MDVALPLERMSLQEKLRTLERLWDDLCRNEDALPSPGWHEAVLAERERLAADGNEHTSPWEEAKAEIRRTVERRP